MPPRFEPVPLETLPNWSPSADFVTTDEFSRPNQAISAKGNPMVPGKERPLGVFVKPDRIFATSGKGINGAVTEYRHGVQAKIGLDTDYSTPIRRCWMFPAHLVDSASGFHLLLSLPNSSTVLHFPQDLSQADEADLETVQYDLSSRTIEAAQVSDKFIIQVTENYLTFVTATQRCVAPCSKSVRLRRFPRSETTDEG